MCLTLVIVLHDRCYYFKLKNEWIGNRGVDNNSFSWILIFISPSLYISVILVLNNVPCVLALHKMLTSKNNSCFRIINASVCKTQTHILSAVESADSAWLSCPISPVPLWEGSAEVQPQSCPNGYLHGFPIFRFLLPSCPLLVFYGLLPSVNSPVCASCLKAKLGLPRTLAFHIKQ